MLGVLAGKHLRGRGLPKLRAPLSLDPDTHFLPLPLADAMHLVISIQQSLRINTTSWPLEQDSLQNVAEARASKAVFSLKREEIHNTTQFSLTVNHVNFRFALTP